MYTIEMDGHTLVLVCMGYTHLVLELLLFPSVQVKKKKF